MRCLIYQTANDRLHNVMVSISAFLWRLPETEPELTQGHGATLRAYIQLMDERRRIPLRWGLILSWIGDEGIQSMVWKSWPWVAVERAPSSRVFADPHLVQGCSCPGPYLQLTIGGSSHWCLHGQCLNCADADPLADI